MRVPASWHRKPDGRWVFWHDPDQQDHQNCPRYFSAALSESRRVEIELSWPADPITGAALRAEKVGMVGTSPNGQGFIANPLRMWVIDESNAPVGADDFGPTGRLDEQACLGYFWIPQRGIFATRALRASLQGEPSGRRRRGQVAMRRDVSFDTRTTAT